MNTDPCTRQPIALVFGGSGQIGAALLPRLVAAGWGVIAVSRQVQPSQPGVCWLPGELEQPPALPEAVDAIVSCGPLDHFARWYATAPVYSPRVVAFGSTSVRVKVDSGDVVERDLAARLAAGEHGVFAVARAVQAEATVLRPTLVWGAGKDRSLTLMASLAQRMGFFVLPRSARGARQPVHAVDLADAVLAVLACPATFGQTYDVGGGEVLPYDVMVARVLASLPRQPCLLRLPDVLFAGVAMLGQVSGRLQGFGPAARARMAQDLSFDISPAQRDFGYRPRGFSPQAVELGQGQ